MLAASLALNYVLYQKAFLPFYAAKFDPLELNYYPEQAKPARDKPVFLLYGDSRSLSWPDPALEQYQIINRGIGNQSSAQVAMRFEHHVKPLKPAVILLQVCVNDLKTIPLFPEQREQIISGCKNNILQMLSDAAAIEAKVVLSTVLPLGSISPERRLFGFREEPVITAIDEVNDFIHGLESANVQIFDSYELLKGEGGKINPDYSRDWLHLNERGYQRLNEQLVTII
ncbi:MAG: GDSL-type esterase/lipase family protein [Thiolinea sp.]